MKVMGVCESFSCRAADDTVRARSRLDVGVVGVVGLSPPLVTLEPAVESQSMCQSIVSV
jgi:hypothetical protein